MSETPKQWHELFSRDLTEFSGNEPTVDAAKAWYAYHLSVSPFNPERDVFYANFDPTKATASELSGAAIRTGYYVAVIAAFIDGAAQGLTGTDLFSHVAACSEESGPAERAHELGIPWPAPAYHPGEAKHPHKTREK